MVKTRRRALSLVLLVFLPAIIVFYLGLFYCPSVLRPFGLSYLGTLNVMILPTWAMSMVFALLWGHLAMRLPFRPFKQSFLHPRVIKEQIAKFMTLLLALLVFESLSNLATPITFPFSIAIILGSWYAIIVELELSQDFLEYMSLYNPLKRKDEL